MACATTDPLTIDFSATTRKPLRPIQDCAVKTAPVIDARNGKEDLGMLGQQVVEGRHVLSWLQQAIDSFHSPRPEIERHLDDRGPGRNLDVQVMLKQLYVHPLQSSFATTLVLSVQYRVDEGPVLSRLYRGADTNVNWIGSADAVLDLFNDVLADALRRIAADIKQLCEKGA